MCICPETSQNQRVRVETMEAEAELLEEENATLESRRMSCACIGHVSSVVLTDVCLSRSEGAKAARRSTTAGGRGAACGVGRGSGTVARCRFMFLHSFVGIIIGEGTRRRDRDSLSRTDLTGFHLSFTVGRSKYHDGPNPSSVLPPRSHWNPKSSACFRRCTLLRMN